MSCVGLLGPDHVSFAEEQNMRHTVVTVDEVTNSIFIYASTYRFFVRASLLLLPVRNFVFRFRVSSTTLLARNLIGESLLAFSRRFRPE